MNKKYCDKCHKEIVMPNYVLITYWRGRTLIEGEVCFECLAKGIRLKKFCEENIK